MLSENGLYYAILEWIDQSKVLDNEYNVELYNPRNSDDYKEFEIDINLDDLVDYIMKNDDFVNGMDDIDDNTSYTDEAYKDIFSSFNWIFENKYLKDYEENHQEIYDLAFPSKDDYAFGY